MFKRKFCQIDGHSEVDCRKKKSASKDNSSDKDKTAKDKDTKTSNSVFFSESSAPAAADPDSEDASYEPRAYVVNAIQSNLLTSSEGGSQAMPDIVSDNDSLHGLIVDSDDDSLQAKLSNTSVKCIPLGSKTCIVRADFITPLIFRPLISSSKLRRQSDFIRRLIIHLTTRCQPCLRHHPPST